MFALPTPKISDNGRGRLVVQVQDARYEFEGDEARLALVRREIHEAWDYALTEFLAALGVIESKDAVSSEVLAKETL